MRVRVKICCIQDDEELALAVAAGADLIGLVGPGLSGPEVLDEARAERLARATPAGVGSTFLTREVGPEALAAQLLRVRPAVVQICDRASPQTWSAAREAAPGIRILQVVHVLDDAAVAEAVDVALHVDGLVLDSGSPASGVFGGTGAVHDWSISARIVDAVATPVWLAGGLKPHNVAEAWATVRPFGLDLCTGVRREGRLHPPTLAAFMAAVGRLEEA